MKMDVARAKRTSDTASKTIVKIRIDLLHSKRKVWRAIDGPATITVDVLHEIIQAAMGWQDCHLWQFEIDRERFGPKIPDGGGWDGAPRDASTTQLKSLVGTGETVIGYTYDFGDSWDHRLTITGLGKAEPATVYPCYIEGKGACPPEDCGDMSGFYDMLDALTDPAHPNHAEIKEWIDEDYDPLVIDEARIRNNLKPIAARLAPRAARKTR